MAVKPADVDSRTELRRDLRYLWRIPICHFQNARNPIPYFGGEIRM